MIFWICKLFVTILHVCSILWRRHPCHNVEWLANLWGSSYSGQERCLLTDSVGWIAQVSKTDQKKREKCVFLIIVLWSDFVSAALFKIKMVKIWTTSSHLVENRKKYSVLFLSPTFLFLFLVRSILQGNVTFARVLLLSVVEETVFWL